LGDIPGTISRILQELRWRKTSWTADVPVIFAGLFPMYGRDVAAMTWGLDCEGKRVERVFERLGTFPVSVLFSRVSRSKAPGKGWASRSLQVPDLVEESLSQQTPMYLYLWKAEIKRWSQRGTVTHGEIFRGGLHFYADLVYFQLPRRGLLSEHFKIKLRHRPRAPLQGKPTQLGPLTYLCKSSFHTDSNTMTAGSSRSKTTRQQSVSWLPDRYILQFYWRHTKGEQRPRLRARLSR